MTSNGYSCVEVEYYNCSKSVKQVLGAFLVFVFFLPCLLKFADLLC